MMVYTHLTNIFVFAGLALLCANEFGKNVSVGSLPVKPTISNLVGNYNNETASWTINLTIILSEINFIELDELDSLRVNLRLLFDERYNNSLFANGLNERFQYIKLSFKDGNINSTESKIVYFDHVYSGHYTLSVEQCDTLQVCLEPIYEEDLGVVETDLRNIDVKKMHMKIKSTLNDKGGNTIAFTVNYFNTSEKFLPFEKFTVTLIPADRSRLPQSLTTNMDEVYYPRLDCSLENITDHIEQVLLGCYNLVSGQYTIRIDPIDCRCNYPVQVVASYKFPCRRYITTNLTFPSIRSRRDELIGIINNISEKNMTAGLSNMDSKDSSFQSTETSNCMLSLWKYFVKVFNLI